MTRPAAGVAGRRGLRVALLLVASALVSGLAVLLWAPAAGLDVAAPFAQLTAFRVQVAAAAAVVAALVLLVPRRPARVFGAALLAVAVSPLPQVLPRIVGDGQGGVPRLTVVSVNVHLDQVAPAAVADLAVARRADAVALPEATAGFAAEVVRLAAAGGLDYRAATDGRTAPPGPDGERQGPYPTSLLVRADLQPRFRPGEPALAQGAVTAVLPGSVSVAAVHVLAPVRGQEAGWAADQAELARACAAGGPLVLAGDLNATLDHSPLRAVLAAGCRDAGEAAGEGLHGTWPAGAAPPLRVVIDHVLLTPAAGAVGSYEMVDVPAGDHRGLVVMIRTR